MKATATELNKHPGKYINYAIKEPVTIERSGSPVVVIVAYEKYLELEDAYWGERALVADQDKSLNEQDTLNFLTEED